MMSEIQNILIEKYGEQMKQTPQSPKFHGEGDVLTHTIMVCDALKLLPEYIELTENQQEILRIAALMHDIGKIKTTVFTDGDWHSPSHAIKGSKMAREFLFKEFILGGRKDLMEMRETICTLIRYHSFPTHAIENENGVSKMHQIASNSLLMPDFSIKMLCILSKADNLGRICDDKEDVLDKIELCKELAIEEGCYESCYPFSSDHTRRLFLSGSGSKIWKDAELYDETWGTVYLMSGLPGVGKDYTIKKQLGDIPMVSLDEIRKEMKVSPVENQGVVAGVARELAKEYLRKHQSFVWNATNLTQAMREQLINLFESYKANVHIIYVESDYNRLSMQNRDRKDIVPQNVIDNMLGKLVPPLAFEAKNVTWICP